MSAQATATRTRHQPSQRKALAPRPLTGQASKQCYLPSRTSCHQWRPALKGTRFYHLWKVCQDNLLLPGGWGICHLPMCMVTMAVPGLMRKRQPTQALTAASAASPQKPAGKTSPMLWPSRYMFSAWPAQCGAVGARWARTQGFQTRTVIQPHPCGGYRGSGLARHGPASREPCFQPCGRHAGSATGYY